MDALIFFAVFFGGCIIVAALLGLTDRKSEREARQREERNLHRARAAALKQDKFGE